MENQKLAFRWIVLLLLFLNLLIAMIAVNCIPPLFSEIVQQVPLTKAQMGVIMGVTTLASLFFAPVGGALSDKIGCRWALGISVIIMAAGGAVRALPSTATGLIACTFILGAGAALFSPSLPKALGMWFPSEELGRANGICFSSMGIGVALAMGISARILSPAFGGWRGVMIMLGVLSFILGVIWIAVFRDRTAAGGQGSHHQNIAANFKTVFKIKGIWLISIFYGLNMIGVMGVVSFLPLIFEERGMARPGELVAVMMGTTVFFNIIGGVLSDKAGLRRPFLIICAVVFGVCIPTFGVLNNIPLITALILGGIALGTIAPVLMAIPVEMKQVGTALAGTAVGIVFMIGNTGGFVGPVVAGKLMDLTGSFWPSFIFLSAALIVAAAFILPLEETGRKGHRT
jgi:cyanate permease